MTLLTQIAIILNALIHFGFAVGEIFFTTYLLEKLFGFLSYMPLELLRSPKMQAFTTASLPQDSLVSVCPGKYF